MTDEQDKYQLPSPDMDVFGPDEAGPPKPAEATEPTVGESTPDEPIAPRGQLRFQDPGNTRPRPPTLGEQRARQQAAEQEQARELAEQADAERKARNRRRIMIGGGVTVGIAALIGGWYLLSPDNVTARCTSNGGTTDGTVVQDQYCDPNYVTSYHGYIDNGIVFLPMLGGGYQQYHYYYGGSGNIGQRVSGGSYAPPRNANVRTGSGQTIQRGGFGVSGHGGGGDSGGSGGS